MRAIALLLPLLTLACRSGEVDKLAPVMDADADGYAADVDCDDANPDVFPGADEVCDGVDDDCDGTVDEDATDAETWYRDADGDGHGDAANAVVTCEEPEGYASTDDDCDDGDAAFHPGAPEDDCTDPSDYNCDGSVGYADADGDGWAACEECDDGAAAVNPGQVEVCDGLDNDCDGGVDTDALDASPFFADTDADGYGAGEPLLACEAPEGTVRDDSDCDDHDDAVHPGAIEICNGHDDDCNGVSDLDATDAPTWYRDANGDGYGTAHSTQAACAAPEGWVDNALDCDDLNGAAFPGNPEVCDGADNDCDGSVDVGASDMGSFYTDSDGDGFGDGEVITACEAPEGTVDNHRDCDDSAAAAHPGGVEVCDGLDNDCDGGVDTDAIDAPGWYADGDEDGFGDGDATFACEAPAGHVALEGDCDDLDDAVHPGAIEVCNGYDDDCNGVSDLDATDAPTWYRDADGDGFGTDAYTLAACVAPTGYVAIAGDCDDLDGTRSPGAAPACDGRDLDCDGRVDHDGDGDGHSDASCGGDDCDDSAPTVYTGAPELCDGLANPCSGALPDAESDLDGDGYVACTEDPGGWGGVAILGDEDCDDLDASSFPGAPQVCDDVDHDCDGTVDSDGDGDGFSDASCGGTDCDDSDSDVRPDLSGGCALGANCAELLDLGWTDSGVYVIDPDGYGTGVDPFEVSCDQETDGGGWTLVFSVHDLGGSGGLREQDFIDLFGHNLWTDESWTYDASASSITSGLQGGLVQGVDQGMAPVAAMTGAWDDLRMSCSLDDDATTWSHWMQVDGYATANGSWDLLGAATNGTAYAVDTTLNSMGIGTTWHDNEPNTINSNHYLCDLYQSTGTGGHGAAQFGFCYTDFLSNPNTMDYGDSVVSLAFGDDYGPDGWSVGYTLECGAMGTTAQQNRGTYAIWLR